MDNPMNRVVTHQHGGFVPGVSDGGPYAWWDPNGRHDASFLNVLNPNPGKSEAEYYYPNDQGARLEWYLDHAAGITRQNVYAGLATGYSVAIIDRPF